MSTTEFVLAHTRPAPVPFVPEVRLHLAQDAIGLWEDTESHTGESQPPPFWAFAWAGGQAVARYVLDTPELVRGKVVLDLASGSGLVAIAAALAGARHVIANDIDPYAVAAIGLNARANAVHGTVAPNGEDLLASPLSPDVDVLLAGDVFYSREMSTRMLAFLERAAARGTDVLAGDPGRAYLPHDRLTVVAGYDVPMVGALENADTKHATVLRPSTPD
ncbi:class I SAM-dependent methyltransferase [Catenuloplanes atrovinosus]|uniref:Nicotinamide N-methyase n=1 Tax=Catenuloplanes atrovinosus TaxID=137266 RepID=A0AAE4C7B8_9ACTN|nr:50S ribosomal protein L11 methyltransferase [Catenuloplanes atrovinosus]MDR7273703.1 putative nicotinamide N-methyase [Catenuloplanes atrovinosus]